ncbi:MAG: SMP-30/gluconolactonase/LRE family protein [Chromatiales bacterium]|nr:SMP-30/gluconolactonase/LRE family protein [Chromatiales bacterium]
MNNIRKIALLSALVMILAACDSAKQAEQAQVGSAAHVVPDIVKVNSDALYPEAVEWDEANGRFLVTSIRKGVISAVKDDGTTEVFASDPRMISAVGIELDAVRDRVLVCNSDPGAGEKSSRETAGKMAALAVFKLSSGELLQYVELATDKEGGHFCNDIAIAADGTAYITDSFSPIIYKVSPDYQVSVLINNEAFTGESFNLNGIVVKENYLLVAKMNSGQLFKIPLENPAEFSEVKVSENIQGADGLMWDAEGALLVIANSEVNSVIKFTSEDGWQSANVMGKAETGKVFATTGTLRDGQVYVMHAMLHVLFNPETKEQLKSFDIVKYKP